MQDPANRDLENLRADHYVIGLRRRLTPSTLFTLEAYLKHYTQLPLDPDDPTLPRARVDRETVVPQLRVQTTHAAHVVELGRRLTPRPAARE